MVCDFSRLAERNRAWGKFFFLTEGEGRNQALQKVEEWACPGKVFFENFRMKVPILGGTFSSMGTHNLHFFGVITHILGV